MPVPQNNRVKTAADVVARFRANARSFLQTFRVPLALCLLAALLDLASTIRFMRLGLGVETHPAIRLAIRILGPIWGPVFGKTCQFGALLLTAIYFRPYARYLFFAVMVIYSWAAWYNLWGYKAAL